MDSVTGTAGGAADGWVIWVTFSRRATDGGGAACVGLGATACKYRDTCKWVSKPSEIQLCSSNDHGGVFTLFAYLLCLCTRTYACTHARTHAREQARK